MDVKPLGSLGRGVVNIMMLIGSSVSSSTVIVMMVMMVSDAPYYFTMGAKVIGISLRISVVSSLATG